MTDAKKPGQVEVTFHYSRHMGPRFIHGGVTISFDSFQPYSFTSDVTWPSDNYEQVVRKSVEEVLIEHQGQLDRTRVVLKRIDWDKFSSCEVGFARAARAAAMSALQV